MCCCCALYSPLLGRNFSAALPDLDGLTYIYQLPHVHKQLIFLSVSLIYFAFYFLVHIYCWHSLKMLATWASSLACSGLHRQVPMAALFQPGKLKSKLSCAQLTCGVIPLSPNLLPYTFKLKLQLLTSDI